MFARGCGLWKGNDAPGCMASYIRTVATRTGDLDERKAGLVGSQVHSCTDVYHTILHTIYHHTWYHAATRGASVGPAWGQKQVYSNAAARGILTVAAACRNCSHSSMENTLSGTSASASWSLAWSAASSVSAAGKVAAAGLRFFECRRSRYGPPWPCDFCMTILMVCFDVMVISLEAWRSILRVMLMLVSVLRDSCV